MDPLQACLNELQLATLYSRFVEEKITACMIESLSDSELIRLGVQTIGDRHRLRQKIKAKSTPEGCRPDDSGSLAQEILNERAALFRPYGRTGRNSACGLNNNISKNRKRPRTWSINFVCLANKESTKVPTTTEREVLRKAGLGAKKIKLNEDDDENTVIEKIMSEQKNEENNALGFPKLKNCGGFELLRTTQNCRHLTVINSRNWSVKEMKSVIGPQANVYIRPIQNNLSMESVLSGESNSDIGLASTNCNGCQQNFTLRQLREHLEVCPGVQEIKDPVEINPGNLSSVNNSNSDQDSIPVNETQTIIYVVNPIQNTDTLTTEADEPAMDTSIHNDIHVDLDSQTPQTVGDIVQQTIEYCKEKNITNPTEILRKLQSDIVTGRPLEVEDVTQCAEGDTNFILVDRNNILSTGFEEIKSITDYRKTLEVQFYNEVAMDYGGPRKEFFRLILMEIKEKYFDHGLRDLLANDYEIVGKVFALSILQNGKIPKFMETDVLKELFGTNDTEHVQSPCIKYLKRGLDSLGLYEVMRNLPILVHIFYKSSVLMTFKMLATLLKPTFSETGSNRRMFQDSVYSAFTRYLREVASGRREGISLSSVLQFITGADEEPLLGFKLEPSIEFVSSESGSFLPTANTCINSLKLPTPTQTAVLPTDSKLFALYDYAFSNTFYGMK